MTIQRRCFISCASAEFRTYREELRRYLTSSIAEVKVQEDFTNGPATLLEKLDDYIANASAVLHLVGKWAGSRPKPAEVRAILERYADFADGTARIGCLAGSRDLSVHLYPVGVLFGDLPSHPVFYLPGR